MSCRVTSPKDLTGWHPAAAQAVLDQMKPEELRQPKLSAKSSSYGYRDLPEADIRAGLSEGIRAALAVLPDTAKNQPAIEILIKELAKL